MFLLQFLLFSLFSICIFQNSNKLGANSKTNIITLTMSQYIQDSRQYRLLSPSLIYGIFSKVVCPSNQSYNSMVNRMEKTSNHFYQLKTLDRYAQQLKLAQDLQHIIINQKYAKMKDRLKKYGRSQFLALNKYFNKEQQKKTQLINEKLPHNRVVYVDRKYNKQFAIKYAAVYQAQQINKHKLKMISSISQKQVQPLVQQFKKQIDVKKQKWNRIYKSLSSKKRCQSLNITQTKKQSHNIQTINKLISNSQVQTQKFGNPVLLKAKKTLKAKGKTLTKKRQKVKTCWQRQTMPDKTFI